MLHKSSAQGDLRHSALRLVSWIRRAVAGREAALLVFGGLWAFGVLAEDLLTGDPLVQVDRRLAGWLHDRATPGLTTAFEAVTTLGSAWVIVPLALATILGLLARTKRAEALFLALVLAGAEGLTLILKAGFVRQRPFFADPLASESSFSFPSGHATVSLAVYGAIGFLLARRSSSWRGRAVWLGAAAVSSSQSARAAWSSACTSSPTCWPASARGWSGSRSARWAASVPDGRCDDRE